MGIFDGLGFSMERAADNMMSPLGLAAQNLARFDSGGIDMGAAAGRALGYHQDKENKNKTRSWLEQNRPDLLPMLDTGGSPAEVLGIAFQEQAQQRQQAAEAHRREQLAQYIQDPAARAAYLGGEVDWESARGGAVKPIEINGQLVDPMTGAVLGDYRDPNSGLPAAPSGYQWTEGGLAAIPGGPADKPIGSEPMPATTQKELFEAEDAVTSGGYVLSALGTALELNKTAADGAWAGQRATIGANIPDVGLFNGDQTDQATIQYQNIVNELALNQLKTIFGAAPTEGERKILLEIQGSVDQPRPVRQQILERAKIMAERRIEEARRKANGLRTGDYFSPTYGQQPAPAPNGGYTILGVDE